MRRWSWSKWAWQRSGLSRMRWSYTPDHRPQTTTYSCVCTLYMYTVGKNRVGGWRMEQQCCHQTRRKLTQHLLNQTTKKRRHPDIRPHRRWSLSFSWTMHSCLHYGSEDSVWFVRNACSDAGIHLNILQCNRCFVMISEFDMRTEDRFPKIDGILLTPQGYIGVNS